MQTIYQPKGKAREYAPWALNIYQGCGFGCIYCWAARFAVETGQAASKAQWHANPRPRPGILEALETRAARQAASNQRDEPILLCFNCDPLQGIEAEHGHTQRAVEILIRHGLRVVILTKAGHSAAQPVLNLMDADPRGPGRHWFGVTLTTIESNSAQRWEPGAASPDSRLWALEDALARGIGAWVSLEPVIRVRHTIGAINAFAELEGGAQHIALGKLNYRQPPEPINWGIFRDHATKRIKALGFDPSQSNIPATGGRSFYIKQDLRRAA
jgi:DNA repair photolyase